MNRNYLMSLFKGAVKAKPRGGPMVRPGATTAPAAKPPVMLPKRIGGMGRAM